jgi:hypothetical protein
LSYKQFFECDQNLGEATELRLKSLYERVEGSRYLAEQCIHQNVRVLRDLGASGAAVVKILKGLNPSPSQPTSLPSRDPLISSVTEVIRQEADSLVSLRQPNETGDDFRRRAGAALDSKTRAAGALDVQSAKPITCENVCIERGSISTGIQFRPPLIITKATRFEDPSSISTAIPSGRPRRSEFVGGISTAISGYQTAADPDVNASVGDVVERLI